MWLERWTSDEVEAAELDFGNPKHNSADGKYNMNGI